MTEKQYLEQAIAILEKYQSEGTSDNTLEVEQTLEQIQNVFDITEKNLEKIKNILQKTKLKPKEKPSELEEGDRLILKGLIINAKLRMTEDLKSAADFDNDKFDIEKLLKILKKKLNSIEKAEEKKIKQEALKRLKEKGIEINAENLAQEADISKEEAQKYLNLLERVYAARAKLKK